MTNVAKPNGTSETDMAGAPGMTAVHTIPAKIPRVRLRRQKRNKMTFANKMPCGYILYIQAACLEKSRVHYERNLHQSPFQASLIFMHEMMTYTKMIKVMELVNKEGNNHKPLERL